MKELLLVVCYWTHLTATVVWLGGIAFILFFAMPASGQVLGAESGRLMGEISKKFTPAANLSIIVLVISGTGIAFLENAWSSALTAKLIPVFGMVGVHLYRGLVLGPRIMRTEDETKKKSMRKLSINLVRANLAFGSLVLLMSGALSAFRGY